jgi:hypothetical protein
MAVIGIITDNVSHYVNRYPHMREELPIFKKMVQEGHKLMLLSPSASPTVMKNYHSVETRVKLQDWFTLAGLVPVPDGVEQDIDILYVNLLPWKHGFNWDIEKTLVHYADKVDKVFWRITDYELDSSDTSWLFKVIKNGYPNIYKKVVVFDNNIDYCNKKDLGIPFHYVPHTYDDNFNIDINWDSKNQYSVFIGPVGYRTNMLPYIDALYTASEELGVKSSFYGESYAEKYRDSRVSMYKRYKALGNFNILDERIFLPYRKYQELISKFEIHLHDSIPPGWLGLDCRISPYFSHKIYDAVYSGTLPVSTKFYWYERIFEGEVENLLIMSEDYKENLKKIHTLVNLSNYTKSEIVKIVRENLRKMYDINSWYQVIKDNMFN